MYQRKERLGFIDNKTIG